MTYPPTVICHLTLGRASKLLDALKTIANIELIYFPIDPYEPAINRLRTLFHALRETARNRPAVLISDGTGPYALVLLLAAKINRKARFVARLRGDIWSAFQFERQHSASFMLRFRAQRNLALSRTIIGQSDLVFPVSEFLGEIAISETGIDRRKVVPVPTTLPLAKFRPLDSPEELSILRSELGIAPLGHILFSLTNFDYYQKTVVMTEFCPVLNQLHEQGIDVTWVIGGSGTYMEKVREKIYAQALKPERVKFLGHVQQPEQWYQASDLFVHYTELDSLGNVLIEAGACGKPVLANDYGPLHEVVIHNVTGFLVDKSRPHEVALLCHKLLTSPEDRKRIGDTARNHIVNTFSPQAVGMRISAIINRPDI